MPLADKKVAWSLKMRLLLIPVLLFQVAFAWKPHYLKIDSLGASQAASNNDQDEHWFDQKLDHYGPANRRIWKQRYFMNDKYFEIGSPVFLMIGGEEEADKDLMETGMCQPYAEKFKPLCFMLEHRFYGKSHPREDMSVENLVSLTTEQALGDLGFFIEGMNRKYNLTRGVNKWVTFGGSYAGSLSTWMRLKFPHFVHAAVSDGAPLHIVPEFGYYDHVSEVLASHSQQCLDAVSTANKELETLLSHRKENPKDIDDSFNLCDSIVDASQSDVSNLFHQIAEIFAEIVQSYHWSSNIDFVCNLMSSTNLSSPLKQYAGFIKLHLNATNKTCFDYKYQKMIKRYQNESWESSPSSWEVSQPFGGRQWLYHICTELGMFQTSSSTNHLFGNQFPLEFFLQQCTDVFGPSVRRERLLSGISLANFMYGGLDIEVRRVVFVHGSIDPWHTLGITESNNPEAPAIFINGTSHCAHMFEEREDDPEELKDARRTVSDLLAKWLHP